MNKNREIPENHMYWTISLKMYITYFFLLRLTTQRNDIIAQFDWNLLSAYRFSCIGSIIIRLNIFVAANCMMTKI